MASCCLELAQVGLKLAQVGSKLAQVGPKISSGSLQEALLEGPGVQAGSWSQEALLEAPEVPKLPPDGSQIHEKSIRLISDLKALASE